MAEASTTQILLTLSRDNEIIKTESLDKSGDRHELGIEDFAALMGHDDAEGFFPVLEQAYEAGFSDASSDVFDLENGGQADDFERMVVRGVASRRLIRRNVRKLILGRLVRRELLRKQCETGTHPAPQTSH